MYETEATPRKNPELLDDYLERFEGSDHISLGVLRAINEAFPGSTVSVNNDGGLEIDDPIDLPTQA